jgi:hypothetical protein
MGTYLPPGGAAMPPEGQSAYGMPSPPRLHWGWILALDLLTRGFFGVIWLIVQANWVRSVRGSSVAFGFSLAHICGYPFLFAIGIAAGLMGASSDSNVVGLLTIVGGITMAILWLATVFTLRSELSAEPIDIPLGGIMTFFFGPLYFQYFLRDYKASGSRSAADGVLGLSQPNV